MCMAAQCIGKTLAIPGTEWRKESAGYPGEHPADTGSSGLLQLRSRLPFLGQLSGRNLGAGETLADHKEKSTLVR